MAERRAEERWASEAAFFDDRMRGIDVRPLSADVLRRYTRVPLRRRFMAEYRISLLGDVRGKRILDVGCGDGPMSVLFAKLGAEVTGLDLSPLSLDVARERARLTGVSDRTSFLCAPIEQADLPRGSFDVVWMDMFLHHVIPTLEDVLTQVVSYARPGGLVMAAEPVNLWPALREMRLRSGAPVEATPDERPLEAAEIAIMRRILPSLRVEPYRALGRLERFILPDHQYETASFSRRAMVNALALADYAILRAGGERLASTAVLWGRRAAV